MLNTCALFGGSGYATGWLSINYLVIIIGFLLVAIVYMIGKFLPEGTKAKITGMTKVEITQLLISAIIIGILVVFATAACNVSASLSQQLSQSSLQPFQYAEYYVGTLAFNTGFKLLSFVYSLSMTYTIEGRVATKVSGELLYAEPSIPIGVPGINIFLILAYNLDSPYYIAADFYLGLFAPLITVAIGALFLQYLALPAIQFTAFTIILPLALIVRSIAYAGVGNSLRNTGNALLALAIALYIIYPMTVALDVYIMHWLFTATTNPSLAYLQGALSPAQIPSTFFSSASSTQSQSVPLFGIAVSSPTVQSMLGTVLNFGVGHGYFLPTQVPTQAQQVIDTSAQFLFQAIILFGIDIAITIAFAQSLARALNSGIEGSSPFWSG